MYLSHSPVLLLVLSAYQFSHLLTCREHYEKVAVDLLHFEEITVYTMALIATLVAFYRMRYVRICQDIGEYEILYSYIQLNLALMDI